MNTTTQAQPTPNEEGELQEEAPACRVGDRAVEGKPWLLRVAGIVAVELLETSRSPRIIYYMFSNGQQPQLAYFMKVVHVFVFRRKE